MLWLNTPAHVMQGPLLRIVDGEFARALSSSANDLGVQISTTEPTYTFVGMVPQGVFSVRVLAYAQSGAIQSPAWSDASEPLVLPMVGNVAVANTFVEDVMSLGVAWTTPKATYATAYRL